MPPGYYIIRARAQLEPGGGSVFATFQVILENEDVSNIRMALGPGAQLSGRVGFDATRSMPPADPVRDENREIVTDRTVVTLPSDVMLRRPRGRHVRLAYPDLNGQYQIQGLPAGPYLVAAVEDINKSDLYEMETLERVASGALPKTMFIAAAVSCSAKGKRRHSI